MTEKQYELIKSQGYRIDTRGSRFTLIKDVWAKQFETEQQAYDAAMREIADKTPEVLRYRNGV